jgi:transposase-like protein
MEGLQISLKANKTQNSYLFIDVTDLKIEYGLHYKNKALFVVTGIRDDGLRETLGARLADSEDSLFWQDLFEDLKVRGLRDVKLIVSDGHKGIQKTVRESFTGSS